MYICCKSHPRQREPHTSHRRTEHIRSWSIQQSITDCLINATNLTTQKYERLCWMAELCRCPTLNPRPPGDDCWDWKPLGHSSSSSTILLRFLRMVYSTVAKSVFYSFWLMWIQLTEMTDENEIETYNRHSWFKSMKYSCTFNTLILYDVMKTDKLKLFLAKWICFFQTATTNQ